MDNLLLPILFQFMPFAALFFMAVDVYSRNPRNRQHRMIMLLLLAFSLLFFGEFLSIMLPDETAKQASRYVKLIPAFAIMTIGLLLFRSFAVRGSAATPRSWITKAVPYLPLAGIGCLVFAPDLFTIDIDGSGGWHSDIYSPELIALLVAFAAYTTAFAVAELWRIYALLRRNPHLVMERNRVRLILVGTALTVAWSIAAQVVFAAFHRIGDVIPAGTVATYGVIFFAWSVRRAMVRYHFLISSGKRYEKLLEMSRSGIAVVDQVGRFEEANAVFLRLFGLSGAAEEEWRGKPIRSFFAFENDEIMAGFERDFNRFGRFSREAVILNRLNERYVLEGDLESFEMDGQLKTFIIANDVTDKKAAAERLAFLAYHDALTGLGNRVKFSEALDEALGRIKADAGKLAVMLVDLDQFKWINDTLGHTAGDELLKAVADRLNAYASGEGSIVARLGGDEFVLLFPEISDEREAEFKADRLRDLMYRPIYLSGKPFQMTASIGISLAPRDGTDAESVIRRADSAMHAAKRSGRNQAVMYSPTQQASAENALSLMNGLHLALERDEFELHYQPQTDLGTGRIIGLEALLRWRSGEIGVVSPADFIPLAEESGAIVPIGDWVLRTALRDGMRWLESGHNDLLLSVNLSARQLREPRFADYVAGVLRECGFPAGNLCLEITESSAMIDPEETLRICMELVRLGITLAIDDFGTGYSSLSMINRFPFTIVKIDKSLIRDIETSKKDAAVIRTIVQLSRHLDMVVLAEGVETREQEKLLLRFGCHKAQGFLRGKPVPAETIDRLLAERGSEAAGEV